MNVSANTLFHFTKKDNLKSILSNHFYPQYHLEYLSHVTPRISIYKEAYIPMVCFCDLLFSQIKSHIDFYGDYGVGLRKAGWGIEWGISPIIYLPDNSISALNFKEIAKKITTGLSNKSDRNLIRNELQNFYKYIKPYKGKGFNKMTGVEEDKTFYDEREWRYVPRNSKVLSKFRTTDKAILNRNEEIKLKEKLSFKAEDVKYIIVNSEDEIPEFVDFINKELKTQFKPSERKILTSKLISVTQIREDM